MITGKKTGIFVVVIICVAVLLCAGAVFYTGNKAGTDSESGLSKEYETKLFDTSEIMKVDIQMDEDQWQEMLDNASSEEYYSCDIVVNGSKFYNVGIRPKGNTSLLNIAMDPDNNRYSFKLEFDHYEEGQTCFGLDKLILNNNYADKTNMKEAIVYDMFKYLDADASLYNYAQITLNGNEWGIYLALEGVEESFLERNYGRNYGKLYKPDTMEMGGGKDGGQMPEGADWSQMPQPIQDAEQMPEGQDWSQMPQPPQNGGGDTKADGGSVQMPDQNSKTGIQPTGNPAENSSQKADNTKDSLKEAAAADKDTSGNFEFDFGGDMPGGFGGGSGAELNYIDDDLDSYSAIWEGAVTDSDDNDHKRVVTALKNISNKNEIEKYMDVDNVLRYMAVHTFAVNLDSLSGSMAHNYYLYEKNGKLNLIPWDYNLSFGGFQSGNASDTINFPIDTPFSGQISLEDRKFFAALLENEEYLERYHEYLRMLTEEYVGGGLFDETYNRIKDQISDAVKTDPNAQQTYEEYEAATEMLNKVVKLRSESIKGQLYGNIPSTTEGQNTDSSSLIDCSGIDLSVMGTMMGGGDRSDKQNVKMPQSNIESGNTTESISETQASGGASKSGQPVQEKAGADTEKTDNSETFGVPAGADNTAEEVKPNQSETGVSNSTDKNFSENDKETSAAGGESAAQDTSQWKKGMPEGFPEMGNTDNNGNMKKNLILWGGCLLLLLAAIIIARRYK